MSDQTNAKLNKPVFDSDDFEERLKKQTEERERERDEYYRMKALLSGPQGLLQKDGHTIEDPDAVVYKARAAAKTHKDKPFRKEGAIHRTFRLIKGFSQVHKRVKSEQHLTSEMRRNLYMDVVKDAWSPAVDWITEFEENFWDFITILWGDIEDIVLFIVDAVIVISYYFGSLCLYIWDIIWDIRLWLDERKKGLFQIFAAGLTAMAIITIFISSITGYEYSYYGRVLGICRSKEEVYRTIEALGDKLSAATGANVNLDVERDIEFKKVYGFHMNVDDSEDILNTITYMKDIQARVYAISIDGEQKIILESEEAANELIERFKAYFMPERENVEYLSAELDKTVTIDEIGAQLGDIWNEDDALNYLLTGSADGNPEEGISPLINVSTTLLYSYVEETPFDTKYIDNSTMYLDETDLITAGVTGKTDVVTMIYETNGQETATVEQSRTKISNPVAAVYYKGTKPLPEREGTGVFLYPVKNGYISSKFGSRNTGIVGASTYHLGIDIAATYGSKIYASDGGTVTFAGYRSGYGYVVFIDHGGLYETRYAHCSKLAVKKGDTVYQGQYIANVGSSGISSGAHCHFEVLYKGTQINPLTVLTSE